MNTDEEYLNGFILFCIIIHIFIIDIRYFIEWKDLYIKKEKEKKKRVTFYKVIAKFKTRESTNAPIQAKGDMRTKTSLWNIDLTTSFYFGCET